MYDIFICSKRKKLRISVDDETTVHKIKKKLYNFNNIIPERQKMIFHGRTLKNNETMKSANIIPNTTIHMVFVDEYKYWKKSIIVKKTIDNPNIKRRKQISISRLNYIKKILKESKTSFFVNTILLQNDLNGDTVLYSNENNQITFLMNKPTSIYKYLCLTNPLYVIE